jgi:archaemetzincin
VTGRVYLGFLNGYMPSWADRLVPRVQAALPLTVRRTELRVDLPRYYAAERAQYNATLILAGLLRHVPENGARVVGITRVDLFIPVLTFVFGQAQLDGAGAVVSTYRLRTEFYGLPSDESLLLERTVKEIVHEAGHTLGLTHCDNIECVMHASTYVEEVDLKTDRFCQACETVAVAGLAV